MASALARVTPTMTPPISPGPPAAATPSSPPRPVPAAAVPELAAPDAIEIVAIRTTGDRVRDRALAEVGGKGLFTKEIEDALIADRVDLAVHSLKDVPTWMAPGLAIVAVLPREDPR